MHVLTFYRLQLKRHMCNPVLWLIGIAAPVAAHFMVPAQGSTYTVVGINGAFPILTSGVIGLELGIIASLLLSPLAYIYLRVSSTRITPWQVEDATPAYRIVMSFGHWLADTTLLIFLLFILAVAGVLLSFFRLDFSQINPLHTFYTLFIIAIPAFAMIAAVKAWFNARPWLRGGLGDSCFFLLWMAGILMGAVFFETEANSFIDVFGYAASINNAVDVPIETFSVGSAPVSGLANNMIAIDAIKGVSDGEYLLSRFFWIMAASGLAIFSGVCFAPRQAKNSKSPRFAVIVNKINKWNQNLLFVLFPKNTPRLSCFVSEINQILTPNWIFMVLIAISAAGLFLPFKQAVMPALWLVLIFLLSTQSSRWQSRSLKAYLSTLEVSNNRQMIIATTSAIIFIFVLCIPSIITLLSQQQFYLLWDVFLLCVIVPIIIYSLGRIIGSAAAARLLMLVAWYMYLNS